MGFLRGEVEGVLFKLYRADVELSCPRTPEPTSDGQWEECPAAGSIMHFQHLKTMSVRSTTPSLKMVGFRPKSYSARPRLILSAVFLINICVAILASSHFRYPCCVLSYCLLWYLYFFCTRQDAKTDKLASRFQNRQLGTKHAMFWCNITTER